VGRLRGSHYEGRLDGVRECRLGKWEGRACYGVDRAQPNQILEEYAADPEECIVRAVNDTKDNDTIASIVGAAVGGLYGRKGLPKHWINGLVGRTRTDDDSHVLELLDQARHTFAP
jgi:hypothetical protein